MGASILTGSAGEAGAGPLLRLRSAVGMSLTVHALVLALAFVAAERHPRVEPLRVIPVSLNLGPLRNPVASRPATAAPLTTAAPVAPATPAASAKSKPSSPARLAPIPTPRPATRPKPPAEPPRIARAEPAPTSPRPRPAAPPARVDASPARNAKPTRGAQPPAPAVEPESAMDRVVSRMQGETAMDAPVHGGAPGAPALAASSGRELPAAIEAGTASGRGAEDLVAGYAALIREAVESAYRIPAGVPRGEASNAVVHVRVDATGHVLAFSIARSSGFEVLDEVLRGVFSRIALPPPPPAIAGRAQRGGLRIVFPFASSAGAST